MKKYISLILTGLLMAVMTNAQDPETLTNNAVVKMSKARLSDELITDMIRNSPVRFDLSSGAIRNLGDEGVTPAVIQAMKDAAGRTAEPGKPSSASEKSVIPVPAERDQDFTEMSAYEPSKATGTVSLTALNYVGPLIELIKFNETKFKGLEITIAEWDKQVRGYISDINKVKGQMLQVENELRMMKNADTKAFSDDIISLKGKLEAYRKNYKQTKEIMVKGGATIVKNIEAMSSDAARDLGKAYSEASQQVSSANSNPASGENPVAFTYTKREVSGNSISYIVYLNEMLAWHQNEIEALNDLIDSWNPRVTQIINQDAQLRSQLEPIEKKLGELSSNQKLNKAEISTLKKQISDLEKSRKKIADQMKDDAKDLASAIKQMSQKNQDALKERFTDIMENITYSFVEKLSI
ncbi:MAG: hypothetical protein WAV93_03495 [Bacteroidales bacterium]